MGLGDKLKPYPALHRIADKIYFLREEYFTMLPLKFFYLWESVKHKDKKTAVFYPEMPRYYHTLYQICRFSGFRMTNKPQKADVYVHFEDTTFRKYDRVLRQLMKKNRIINIRCKDISKRKIDEVHKKAFGYKVSIDPRKFKGDYVKKGNINSLHNGEILSIPEEPKPGFVYQRLVNNQFGDELIELRTPIIGKTIPFIYVKHRPLKNRFGSDNKYVEIADAERWISKVEYKNIVKFCDLFGLDCGEMDILRDKVSKRLYIVDANNTPASPPYQISAFRFKDALRMMSEAFTDNFLRW